MMPPAAQAMTASVVLPLAPESGLRRMALHPLGMVKVPLKFGWTRHAPVSKLIIMRREIPVPVVAMMFCCAPQVDPPSVDA